MRTEIPPPGRPMAFPDWSEAIFDCVRRYLPDARAVGKQPKRGEDTKRNFKHAKGRGEAGLWVPVQRSAS
jgi:hypothetical protein